jgi:putative toxin-antitoxin system antitoxin component (TIGR02293 family)
MSTATVKKKQPSTLVSKYVKYFDNPISILSTSKKGLKAEAVFDFISISGFPTVRVEQLLNKTLKTFNNYKENDTSLDATTSEKLLMLFSLYHRGSIVFGSLEEFNKWITEPAFGLGKQLPQDLLDTITGIQLVDDELARIEYGDLA